MCLRIITRDDVMSRRSMNMADARLGRSRRREGGAKNKYRGKRNFCLGEHCRIFCLIKNTYPNFGETAARSLSLLCAKIA